MKFKQKHCDEIKTILYYNSNKTQTSLVSNKKIHKISEKSSLLLKRLRVY